MVKKNTLKGINNFLGSLNLFNNKSAKKSYNGILIIAGILGFVLLMNFVFADHQVSLLEYKAGSTAFLTINEDIQATLNITINSTDKELVVGTGATNITQINVTLPDSFILNSNSTTVVNNSGILNFTFTNTTTFLKWVNNTPSGLMGNSTGAGVAAGNINATLSFNVTAPSPGNYTLTVETQNRSTNRTNYLALTVNDTTGPWNVDFNSQTPVKGSNLSVREIIVNVSANDTFSQIGSFNITLFFPNGTIANWTNLSGNYNDSARVNFSGTNLVDGQYRINVSQVRDNPQLRGFGANNTNSSITITRNITIDLTVPTVTLAKASSSTSGQIVLDVTVSDATSGIAGKQCSASGGGSGSIAMSGTGGTQTATQTGLGCSSSYIYTVTCTDYSGNAKSTEITTSTDTCTGGSSSGTSGGSGSDVVGSVNSNFWILTYNEATIDLNGDPDGVSSLLLERYRVKVKIDTKLYYLGVVDTTDTTAKINVTTNVADKEATLNVGDVKKFDVNEDNFYDLSVTLNGIDSATGKADLKVIYIQEVVVAEEQAGVEEQAGTGTTTPTTAKSKAWIWIVAGLVVLAIIGAILFGSKKSRHKNYGF
ncbi:MAG: hypothetical protein AABY06_01720 [Nanoarchaeota archaeon]